MLRVLYYTWSDPGLYSCKFTHVRISVHIRTFQTEFHVGRPVQKTNTLELQRFCCFPWIFRWKQRSFSWILLFDLWSLYLQNMNASFCFFGMYWRIKLVYIVFWRWYDLVYPDFLLVFAYKIWLLHFASSANIRFIICTDRSPDLNYLSWLDSTWPDCENPWRLLFIRKCT